MDFHILDHATTRNLSDPIEKCTDWERFHSLASDLVSPTIKINSGVEADKAARDFVAPIFSAYRLSTCTVTLSDLNSDLPGLDRLLKHKQRLRKLWHETRDPACKTAVNWVTKTVRPMTRSKALAPNECLRHFPRRPLVHFTHLFNHCIRLSCFPEPWNEGKAITLPKPSKDTKFPQNSRPLSLLSTTGKLFEKIIPKIIQSYIYERDLLDANLFGFRARHSTTLQCTSLADHVTLNFSTSTIAVFLDTRKAVDTIWSVGLLYKLSKLHFLSSLIKLISSFLSNRRFRVSLEYEMSTPRGIQAGVLQCSLLSKPLYSLYINNAPESPSVHLALFADDTWIFLPQIAKRLMFSDSCNAASLQWSHVVSAGT
jgi:hypothetical protein